MELRPQRRIVSGLVAIAAMDQLAITLSQQGLAVLSVAFKAYAHLDVAGMGLLFSTVAFGAVLGMLPAGIALDRLGVRRVAWLAGGSVLAVLALLALTLPRSFWALEGLLLVLGLTLPALSLSGATAVTTRLEGSQHIGLAIGVRQAATPLGGMLAAALFPLLLHRLSLSSILLGIGLNAGLWTMLLAWILPPRPVPHATATRPLHAWVTARRLVGHLRGPLSVSFLLSPGQYALLTYALLDLHDALHIRTTTAGPILAVALLAGFLQRILMGRIADRGVDPRRLIAANAGLGAVALLTWGIFVPHRMVWSLVVFVFVLLGLGVDGWNALLTTWVTEATAASERGLALGLSGLAGFGGVVVFLPVFGFLVRLTGGYAAAWVVLAAAYLIGAALSLRLSPRRKQSGRGNVAT